MNVILFKVSRRTTLQWLAAATVATALPRSGLGAPFTRVTFEPVPRGYGTDPTLKNPVVPWERVMSEHQLALTAILADLILPATQTAPAPSELHIPDFVDEWVSAPYPQQQADRALIFDGLAWLDAETQRRWRIGFLEADAHLRQQLIETIACGRGQVPVTPQQIFFRQFRFVVVGAYYTTPAGFEDIGYVGNVPLASYPPITERERAILDERLAKLGLARP